MKASRSTALTDPAAGSAPVTAAVVVVGISVADVGVGVGVVLFVGTVVTAVDSGATTRVVDAAGVGVDCNTVDPGSAEPDVGDGRRDVGAGAQPAMTTAKRKHPHALTATGDQPVPARGVTRRT